MSKQQQALEQLLMINQSTIKVSIQQDSNDISNWGQSLPSDKLTMIECSTRAQTSQKKERFNISQNEIQALECDKQGRPLLYYQNQMNKGYTSRFKQIIDYVSPRSKLEIHRPFSQQQHHSNNNSWMKETVISQRNQNKYQNKQILQTFNKKLLNDTIDLSQKQDSNRQVNERRCFSNQKVRKNQSRLRKPLRRENPQKKQEDILLINSIQLNRKVEKGKQRGLCQSYDKKEQQFTEYKLDMEQDLKDSKLPNKWKQKFNKIMKLIESDDINKNQIINHLKRKQYQLLMSQNRVQQQDLRIPDQGIQESRLKGGLNKRLQMIKNEENEYIMKRKQFEECVKDKMIDKECEIQEKIKDLKRKISRLKVHEDLRNIDNKLESILKIVENKEFKRKLQK